jgi:hypothetical protein
MRNKIGLKYFPFDPVVDPPPPVEVLPAAKVYVEGDVYDNETGHLVLNGKVRLVSDDGQTTQFTPINNGTYWARTDQEPTQIFVHFSFPGYADRVINILELQTSPDVGLDKSKVNTALLLALIAAFILWAKRKKKKVGKVTTGDIIPWIILGGGILAFDTIQNILEALGLWKTKGEKELDAHEGNPNSWWSPNFWRSKPASASWTYTIDRQTAESYAGDIWDAFGWFNDCEECVTSIFKKLRTKANASYLAEIFTEKYGMDLLKFLRGGWWPQDRLSDTDVKYIDEYLEKLPNY